MILIYTKNHFIRNSFSHFFKEKMNGVYFYSDKISFLVTATLLGNALLVLDLIDSPMEDVMFVHNRLTAREKSRNIFYMTNPKKLEGMYGFGLKVISSVSDMLNFSGVNEGEKYIDLYDEIILKVHGTLCRSHSELLCHEVCLSLGRDVYIDKHGRKAYINRRYNLYKRLNLETMLEYNCLIYMLKRMDQTSLFRKVLFRNT